MEIWADIKGYEGIYQVSSLGRVKNAKGKVLQPTDNGHGYKIVKLYRNSTRKNAYVHRIVAETFIPKTAQASEINHIDRNKANNAVQNLEWVTHSQNMLEMRGVEQFKKHTSIYGKYIYYNPKTKKFRVMFPGYGRGKKRHIGCYSTLEQALETKATYQEGENK